jgi:hypothetical protein
MYCVVGHHARTLDISANKHGNYLYYRREFGIHFHSDNINYATSNYMEFDNLNKIIHIIIGTEIEIQHNIQFSKFYCHNNINVSY